MGLRRVGPEGGGEGTDFGQSNFGQSISGSGVCHGPKVGPKPRNGGTESQGFEQGGATRQPESPNVHMSGSRPSNTTKIQRKDPKEREER